MRLMYSSQSTKSASLCRYKKKALFSLPNDIPVCTLYVILHFFLQV